MPGRRNPLKLDPSKIKLPRIRRRPDPFPSDDDLRLQLAFWTANVKLTLDWQVALNFRLDDLLTERRPRRSPVQQAVADVAALLSGRFGPGWTETHACREVARVRRVSEETLARTLRFKKKRPVMPRTKSP